MVDRLLLLRVVTVLKVDTSLKEELELVGLLDDSIDIVEDEELVFELSVEDVDSDCELRVERLLVSVTVLDSDDTDDSVDVDEDGTVESDDRSNSDEAELPDSGLVVSLADDSDRDDSLRFESLE